jgi:hypothetical protein
VILKIVGPANSDRRSLKQLLQSLRQRFSEAQRTVIAGVKGARILRSGSLASLPALSRNWSLSHLEIIDARLLVSTFARSATDYPVMCEMTRGLAKRGLRWTLDRKPRVANLRIAGLSASRPADVFVARTT